MRTILSALTTIETVISPSYSEVTEAHTLQLMLIVFSLAF